ncbi:MAG: DUF58 domain-containing protein, partial [Chloroflexi bacterium]|nr:DUF58 domain-containing protein [Chloroflexota bacterium]
MLTNQSLKLISVFTACLIAGLLLGNLIILSMCLLPIVLLLVGMIVEQPKSLSIKTNVLKTPIWVGNIIEVTYEITVNDGFGMITVFQELPKDFALIDGNNFRIFWKGLKKQTFVFSYKIRCAKRGEYILPSVNWKSQHVLNLTQPQIGTLDEERQLKVQLKILNIGRIRGMPGIANTPFPVIDIARIGVPTTDFRDIRNYVPGDPAKSINWKASARKSANGPLRLLVNEYEVEGKKSVWIFLDASVHQEVGTNIHNAFEYCLEAANGVAYYFLNRDYRLGMYIYNDSRVFLYPDAGKKQFFKVSQQLFTVKTSEQTTEFPQAIEKCRSYIMGYNPLCVIITRLDSVSNEFLLQGVNKLRQLRGHHTRKLPIMVISVPGYNLIPKQGNHDERSNLMLKLKTKPLIQQLRHVGISVLDWNPKKDSFGTAFLRQ